MSGTPISLVLGSGGARGYAHIGVIEELEAQGYAIRSIAGSSMGALVGGIYATGKLRSYADWVRPLQRLDVLRLLDWTFTGGGFIKGDRIIGVLRELAGDISIEDLPIPYTAVAVDLDQQREVWFSKGPLFDAIRASIAIPTLIRPHHYQGRLLVDGGLLNPLPVSPTLRDMTDATIAVDVNALAEPLPGSVPVHAGGVPDIVQPAPKRRHRIAEFIEAQFARREKRGAAREPGAFELFARSLDVVQETITRLKLAAQPPDLLITIPRNACAFYEFHRAEELIELGRLRTREALAKWSSAALRPREGEPRMANGERSTDGS
ncbi:patatin-like phospholipase family protein [Dokdonella sp.]|uniref:patatin-like phospholipase family protein n=1 Tax=Dokdonella sp. TaxID=2291710 RepID=UPI0026251A45|nr:patatin-like phospholipase family protein [Dokdonella sp.]